MKVACIGEVMIELSVSGSGAGKAGIAYAGDTFNTAIYLQREAGPAVQCAYVTALGRDRFSSDIVTLMQAESLSSEALVYRDDRLPGLYAISTDAEGERTFSYWREQSAARTLFQKGEGYDFSILEPFSVLYFSAITLAILPEAVRQAFLDWVAQARQSRGVRVAFDSNYRPRLWASPREARATVERAWQMCDIALPSVDDEMALFGDAEESAVLARLGRLGVEQGALKRGGLGPLSLQHPDRPMDFASVGTVVDSTAAGDSFNAGYLAGLLRGQDEASALQAGHELACRVIGHRGAILPR